MTRLTIITCVLCFSASVWADQISPVQSYSVVSGSIQNDNTVYGGPGNREAFLEFDLSQIPDGVPLTLRFQSNDFISGGPGTGDAFNLYVYQATGTPSTAHVGQGDLVTGFQNTTQIGETQHEYDITNVVAYIRMMGANYIGLRFADVVPDDQLSANGGIISFPGPAVPVPTGSPLSYLLLAGLLLLLAWPSLRIMTSK